MASGPMLATVSGRFPSEDQLEAVWAQASDVGNTVEHLAISLGKLAGDIGGDGPTQEEPLTAETAWHLTEFARSVATIAETISREAEKVQERVRLIYLEQSR